MPQLVGQQNRKINL